MNGETKTIISFVVNGENFAFDALKVRNILEYGRETKIPNTPDFLLGVINLHGNIIPIVDLRIMIGATNPVNSKDTSIIVVSPNDQIDSYLGIVVDLVKEVVQITGDMISPSIIDHGIGRIDSFEGVVKINGEFIHVIHLDGLIEKVEDAKIN